MRRSYGGISCAAAVFMTGIALVSPVMADSYSGIVGAGYSSADGGADGWGAQARALGQYDSLNTQIDISYQKAGTSSFSGNVWQAEGDVFLRNEIGSIGASINHADITAYGLSKTYNSYGAFGEWYVTRFATLQARAGGFNGVLSGSYGGAGALVYLLRHFSLSADYEYVQMDSAGHTSTINGGIEYFFTARIPAALEIQYSHDLQAGGSNAVLFALTYRFGGAGSSLASWDRAGPTRWTGGLAL